MRFETLSPMNGETIKAQVALAVKEYSARHGDDDDPSHRALLAMRLHDGVKRLLEGGHRPPPTVQHPVKKPFPQTVVVEPLPARSSFYTSDDVPDEAIAGDLEDYGMSNHLFTEADLDVREMQLQQEEDDVDDDDQPPAPPPKPLHLRMKMEALVDEPELLESLPELGE